MFLYQGDEIGLLDGPDGDPPDDRYGRDRARHPMQWDAGPQGGFTTGDALATRRSTRPAATSPTSAPIPGSL